MTQLTKIQKTLKAPKSQFNAFGKYNYRNCEDILEALKPLLDGCTLTISDEIVMIGNRFYVKATATLTEDKDIANHITVSAYAREEESKKGMDGAQVTGAASSYARKYALNGLFLIDDTKDADTTNKHGKDVPEAANEEIPAKTEGDAPSPPEENIIFCLIKDITTKEGTSAKGAWKLFLIETVRGDKYGTFNAEIASVATSLKNSGDMGRMEFKQGKKNKEVVSLVRS